MTNSLVVNNSCRAARLQSVPSRRDPAAVERPHRDKRFRHRSCNGSTRSVIRQVLALVCLVGSLGCQSERSKQVFEFMVQVFSDPGVPLKGAHIDSKGHLVGTSNADGLIRLRARGDAGDTLQFSVKCPDGYRAPKKPLSVTVRQLAPNARPPQYQVQCRPILRSVVVAVRTTGAPALPITYLGKTIGVTDEAGAAHVELEAESNEVLELYLDTTEHPTLQPRNPSKRIVVEERDAIVLFDQNFSRPKVKKRVPVAPKKPAGPVRIH